VSHDCYLCVHYIKASIVSVVTMFYNSLSSEKILLSISRISWEIPQPDVKLYLLFFFNTSVV